MQENLLNNSTNKKIRVGIVRFVRSDDDHNLLQARDFFEFLQENLSENYKPVDIFIDKEKIWHVGGLPILPSDLFHQVDVVWNEGNTNYSQVLSNLGIPNVSTNPFFAVLENNTSMLKDHVKNSGIYMPSYLVLESYQEDIDGDIDTYSLKKAQEVFRKFGAPWIVRTNTDKNNEGIHVVKTFPDLVNIIYDFAIHKKNILVEELITGDRVSVHTIENFRNQDIYHFLPKNVNEMHKEKISEYVKDLWGVLNAKHYLNITFILTKKKIYLSDISSSLDLKKDSHLNMTIHDFGVKTHNIIEHILKNAILSK